MSHGMDTNHGGRSAGGHRALIFVHIPKCAGRTLAAILERSVPAERRYEVDPDAIAASRAELAALPASRRANIDLLYGHLSYGWHELLPRPAAYLTLVRDPVERVVSHYNYVRFRPGTPHYLRAEVQRRRMGLKEYVESGVCHEVNNGQVRLLAGVEDIVQEPYGPSRLPYGTNDPGLLDRALRNVERHFVVVGLQDQFDATLLLIRSKLGLGRIWYRSRNVGRTRYRKIRPTNDEVEAIRAYNRLDLALYDAVNERFRRELSTLFMAPARARLAALVNHAGRRVPRAVKRAISGSRR